MYKLLLTSFSKTITPFILVIAFTLPSVAQPKNQNQPEWSKKVGATEFPKIKTIYKVNTYGAIADGQTNSTKAIQAAIDECAKNKGGVVIFEPGSYVTGSIFLKTGVELRIDKEVTILGSQNFADYPEISTRIAGIEMKWPAALINIIGQKKVAITGGGVINARGKFCWEKYWAMRKAYDQKGLRWIVDYDAKRVRTLLVQESSNITLKGLNLKNAGFWTVQLLYSTKITVDGLTIRNNEDGHGPSTDGIDIDSSSWVLVQNCDIDCNDDDFCLKSGRDWDGLRVNRPTEYVVIRKCIARKGGGLLTLGSETSGGIRHVLATDLLAKGTGNGFHIKSATTRGGIVEDIYFQNVKMDSVGNAFKFTMNWNPAYSYSTLPKGYSLDSVPAHWKTMLHKVDPPSAGIPHFKNVYVNDVQVDFAKIAISAEGLQESTLDNFNFSNIQIQANSEGLISFGSLWKFYNVKITSKENKKLEMKNCTEMKIDN